MAGAKAKLVERYADLPHRRVSEIYKALRGTPPPAGPIMQGSARYFTVPNGETSEAWIIQCAIFLECYERMGRITSQPLQRGWRLLAAFNAYMSITEDFHQTTATRRLDINQAYALLTFCGFLTARGTAELRRKLCPVCFLQYPVLARAPINTHRCPACALNTNLRRIAGLSGLAAQRSSAIRRR